MKSSINRFLGALLCVILALGMFPSLTALSAGIAQKIPFLAPYMGPLNPVKIFSPLIFLFIWLNRRAVDRKNALILLSALALGTLATIVAGWICHFPPAFLREWAVMVLGVSGSVALLLLPKPYFRATLIAWASIVFVGVFLNLAVPQVLNSINSTFFDPIRVVPLTPGFPLLIGFYDVASLAKLLVWVPWILFWGIELSSGKSSKKRTQAFVGLLGLATILTLMTTQRGPFVGMLAGWIAFVGHEAYRLKSRKIIAWAGAGLFLLLISIPLVMPKSIWETRLKPLITTRWSTKDMNEGTGRVSIDQRRILLKVMTRSISEHPLGFPCLPPEELFKAGALENYHSHNLILEQFRTRGWIWGTVHLALWLYAFMTAWRGRNLASSVLLGGIATTLVLGLVDHPWFVINHAMILGVFLLGGQLRRSAKGANA